MRRETRACDLPDERVADRAGRDRSGTAPAARCSTRPARSRCHTPYALSTSRDSSIRILNGSPGLLDVARTGSDDCAHDGDDLRRRVRGIGGGVRASSPNRRRQFGHQVPRWNASSTGPVSRNCASDAHGALLRRQLEGRRGSVDGRHVSGVSEQLHFHDLARFDDVGLGGNLDVAVGVRHAGDVARRLERRHRRAVDDAHGVELVAAGRRDDAARERQPDRARRDSRAAAPCGAASGRAAGRRSTGTTSDSRACRAPACGRSRPKTGRLAGLDRDAVEEHLARIAAARP